MKVHYKGHILKLMAIMFLGGFPASLYAEELEVLSEHLACAVTEDCAVLKDPCSPSCSCGVPVAKVHLDHYSAQCKSGGAVCDLYCPPRQVHCVNKRCQFGLKPNSTGKVKLQIDGKWYERNSFGALVPISE